MLYHHINIPRTAGSLHRPEDVRIPGAQILIDKARRLQSQGSEIALLADRFGKVEGEEIIRRLRVAKKSFKDRIVRVESSVFMAIRLPEREGKPDSTTGFTRMDLTIISGKRLGE